MKIAVLFDTNLNNRKGLFNAIVNRTKSLMAVSDCTIDVYCLQAKPCGLNKLVRKQQGQIYRDILQTDELTFNIIWYNRYLTDDVLSNRLHQPPLLFRRWVKKNMSVFSSYDIITSHSTRCGEMARLINKTFGVPFFVTWHGTDIHTAPFVSPSLMRYTTAILQSATCNFFVSKALKNTAQSFATNFKSEVLYNGVGEIFKKYDEKKRNELREKYGVENCKTVAFVGNVIPVKNVVSLPMIFDEVKHKTSNRVMFWIIGDGLQKLIVEKEMKKRDVGCVFLGNRPSAEMPNLMNCIDVLILPSLNEGLPLVLVEALACGANAVGSRAGGIPEVIGEEDSFELGEDFVSNISNRIVFMLTNEVKQVVGNSFNWKEIALKEYKYYNDYIQLKER